MSTPADPTADAMRAWLRQAVPRHVDRLLALPAADLVAQLPALVSDAGVHLTSGGQVLLLAPAGTAADQLAAGVAAAVLISGRVGITLLGDYYPPVPLNDI